MPRKTKIVDEESSSEKLGQQANSEGPDNDVPEVFSIDKLGNDLSDSELKLIEFE